MKKIYLWKLNKDQIKNGVGYLIVAKSLDIMNGQNMVKKYFFLIIWKLLIINLIF